VPKQSRYCEGIASLQILKSRDVFCMVIIKSIYNPILSLPVLHENNLPHFFRAWNCGVQGRKPLTGVAQQHETIESQRHPDVIREPNSSVVDFANFHVDAL